MSEIKKAMDRAEVARRDGEPLYRDHLDRPVYRVLLHGLVWHKLEIGMYGAHDGGSRVYRVERVDGTPCTEDEKWLPMFQCDGHLELLEKQPTLRVARLVCEDHARRQPWRQGAPW